MLVHTSCREADPRRRLIVTTILAQMIYTQSTQSNFIQTIIGYYFAASRTSKTTIGIR
ncbi:hypothetical protein BDZ91DRAFT_721595 [Kalaharituber pfeilii]|nr:hypothetical protein BDZ91DRAFT_721595 [Kalaharituber pfeilii]